MADSGAAQPLSTSRPQLQAYTGRTLIGTPATPAAPPGLGSHDQPAVLLDDLGAEPCTGVAKAPPDPGRIGAARQPGPAELQFERHGLDPFWPGSAQLDQEQQPEVVAEHRVGGVVVEEVPEVEQHAIGHPVEDVRGMA